MTAAHQHARIARDQAPRLDLDLAAQIAHRPLHKRAVFRRQRRRDVRPLVGDAEAAAQIQPRDRVPVGAQAPRQVGDLAIGRLERVEDGQLAADMHVDARPPRSPGSPAASA